MRFLSIGAMKGFHRKIYLTFHKVLFMTHRKGFLHFLRSSHHDYAQSRQEGATVGVTGLPGLPGWPLCVIAISHPTSKAPSLIPKVRCGSIRS